MRELGLSGVGQDRWGRALHERGRRKSLRGCPGVQRSTGRLKGEAHVVVRTSRKIITHATLSIELGLALK